MTHKEEFFPESYKEGLGDFPNMSISKRRRRKKKFNRSSRSFVKIVQTDPSA
jgi:hypothetical protein